MLAKKRQHLILQLLILAKFLIPIICMDLNEPVEKRILNAELATSSADIPIIPLRVPSNQKSSKSYSQVLN